ncbi:hypothetical protein BKA70DRAFT_1373169 [Coprinopsis sp. MPI-PUGE-AT-0042]|nr:hypothetical protein BKA70DRAFT_1373169 [Coprinopsis sp. MPI-PUGE-AT-0042]
MAPSSSSNDPFHIMDGILQAVTSAQDAVHIANYLKNLSPKELRETALASPLSSGQDPLTMLHATQNTLAVLYILVARQNVNGAHPPGLDMLSEFCRTFDPVQARLAPERVTLLAKGIQKTALMSNNPRWAIQPLLNLLTRYAPDGSYLTAIHPVFTLVCLQAKNPSAALPVLSTPITNIDTNLSDLTYNDNLTYHYTGGMALAMLKRWKDAEELFEIAPALQMEALKKLRLSTPYQAFVNSYPHSVDALRDLLHKERNTFAQEKNTGLMRLALDRAPRWALKKLTATYLSLNLADIAKAVKIEKEEEVRAVLLSMIEDGDISASIAADGSVTFSDPPPQFSRAQVDQVLRDVQNQGLFLEHLEQETAKSREYLTKAVKGKDDSAQWAGPPDEEMFAHGGPGGGMWEEMNFS